MVLIKKFSPKTIIIAIYAVVFLFFVNVYANNGKLKTVGIPSGQRPQELEGVGIDEKLGTDLDLGLKFKDENGRDVTLGSFYDGKKPIIISPVYYDCPGLCNYHLNGLTDALKKLDWSVGQKFDVIALSFDSKETPELAMLKKASYMDIYKRAGTEAGWHFLTANQETINAIMGSVGFKYKWNEESKEWSHASAAIVTTPSGKVSRYLPGILFEEKDVRLALNEAASGKIGTFIDSLVLYCFKYDPHQSKYSLYVSNLMKMGGGIMVLILAILLLPIWMRKRKAHS